MRALCCFSCNLSSSFRTQPSSSRFPPLQPPQSSKHNGGRILPPHRWWILTSRGRYNPRSGLIGVLGGLLERFIWKRSISDLRRSCQSA